MTRPLIIHYHLFKNAGSSVEQVLRRHFGPGWVSHDMDHPAASIMATDLAQLLIARPEVIAVSSHQIRPPLPVVPGADVLPIVFVRHPVERIQSVYDFDTRRGPVTPAAQLAAEHDFPDYVRQMLHQDSLLACNFHARTLTDAWDLETARRLPVGLHGHHERARSFLDSLPAVGVVDRWDESWVGLGTMIRRHFPDFEVVPVQANAAPDRPDSLDERINRVRNRLGDALYDELVERNGPDFDLYERATARLTRIVAGS